MSRSRLALVLAGILLFGLLTFALGIVVGIGMGDATPANAPSPAPASALTDASRPAQGGLADTGQPQAADSPSAPAALPAPGAASPPAADASPAGGSPADGVPAAPIVKVSGLTTAPAGGGGSPLMGPLAAQAAAPVLPPPPVEPPEPPSGSDRIISVQVGRFVRPDNAGELAQRLRSAGFGAQIVATEIPGMPIWYIVTLGEQPDEPVARQLAGEVSRTLGLPATVVNWARPEG